MATETDVIVMGVGTGGEDLALQLLDAGLEVVGVEPALVGGECAYWACIPSKMMVRAANLVAEARRLDLMAGEARVAPDWGPVAARIRTEATGDWDDTIARARFSQRGGTVVRGHGRLAGPRTVVVGEAEYVGRIGVVIATGSRPAIPPIPGLADVDYWTTHDVIRADPLPGSLAVLGGGAVGCELGQALARFGVEVTIIEGRDRILPLEEPEASETVTTALRNEGVAVHTGARVERVATDRGMLVVSTGDGTSHHAERLLVATGRAVDLEPLGLEQAGIDGSGRFIDVDERCRAAEGVWAIGDVTGKAMFTHVALHQSAIVAADILGADPPPTDYDLVPRVTFTDPEVGSVGLTEEAARERGMEVDVVVKSGPATFRGWLHGEGNSGLIKLVVDPKRDVLVGATAVGPHGGEVLGVLSVAAQAQIPLSTLRAMIYPYPTYHGGVGEAIGAYARGVGTVLDPGFRPLVG